MARLATSDFLDHLKSLFPNTGSDKTLASQVIQNPWYIVTAVAFCACNRPEEVPLVFQFTLELLTEAQKVENRANTPEAHQEKLLLARRFRECVLKSGMLNGYSRSINALLALHEVMPEDLRDKTTMRDTTISMEDHAKFGEQYFRAMYRDTADGVQGLLDAIYPDMGWVSNTLAYGMVYGRTDILSQVEVSYVLVAALISVDTPRQIGWHLANAQNGGASVEQARSVRQIAIEAAQKCGITWRENVPEVV